MAPDAIEGHVEPENGLQTDCTQTSVVSVAHFPAFPTD